MKLRDLWRQVAAVGRESWVLFIAITIVNSSNYLFHIFVSRLLGPHDYGALGAVLAILTVVSLPLAALQTTVAKETAQHRANGGKNATRIWQSTLRSCLPVAAGVAFGLALLSPLVSAFLHLESPASVVLLAADLLPAVIFSIMRGAFQGSRRFLALGVASAAPVLVRLAVGVAIVRVGGGVEGAVAATVLADITGVMIAAALLGVGPVRLAVRAKKAAGLLRTVGPTVLTLGSMWLLFEMDLALARHYLSAAEAGDYAAAGLLARAVLFVPGAVSLVALPYFSEHRGRGQKAYRWLTSCCLVVAAVGISAAAVLGVGSEFLVHLTFGGRFDGAVEILPTLCLAMVAFGILNVTVYFHIAAGSRIFPLLWLAGTTEALLIAFFHGSPELIALCVLGTSVAVAAGSFLAARSLRFVPADRVRKPEGITALVNGFSVQQPELSLVVPTFNGGDQLVQTVRSLIGVLRRMGRSFEVIVVSDGSTDGCDKKLTPVADQIAIVSYAQRQGKGGALRIGMERARGKYIAFVDGDGDLDGTELRNFLVLMNLYSPDLVIGSKRHPLSQVEYPTSRRIMSWIYQRLVRLLFGLNVRDTQTGMKMVKREVLDAVLPRMLEKRYAFDLEFLVVARRLGYKRVFEAPVCLRYRFESTVSPSAVTRTLLDTAAIFYRRYLLCYYDNWKAPLTIPDYEARQAALPIASTAEQVARL